MWETLSFDQLHDFPLLSLNSFLNRAISGIFLNKMFLLRFFWIFMTRVTVLLYFVCMNWCKKLPIWLFKFENIKYLGRSALRHECIFFVFKIQRARVATKFESCQVPSRFSTKNIFTKISSMCTANDFHTIKLLFIRQ